MVKCDVCGLGGERLMSRFSCRQATTHSQKVLEKQNEAMYKADRRMDADSLLNPENWLKKVRTERESKRAIKNEIASRFGKGPDAPMRCAGELGTLHQIMSEDPFSQP